MSIQSDINQTIGMASALLSINPSVQEAAKKRSELNDINRQEKKAEKTSKVLSREAITLDAEFGLSKEAFTKRLRRVNSDLANGKTVSKKRMLQLEKDYSDFLDENDKLGLMNEDIASLYKNELENASRAFDLDTTYSNYDKYTQARLQSKDWDERIGVFANLRAEAIKEAEKRMNVLRDTFMSRYATGGSQENGEK